MPNPKATPPKRTAKPAAALDGPSIAVAIERLKALGFDKLQPKEYPLGPPVLARGVVPAGRRAPVMAMDYSGWTAQNTMCYGTGFPGYPYLSQLATKPEYRGMAATLAMEMTRKWIEFTTSGEDDDGKHTKKIERIKAAFEELKVQSLFSTLVAQDAFFGRAQFFITIKGAKENLPLVLSPRTVPRDSLERLSAVEAIWTTPTSYNALNPSAVDFYKPPRWFMLGQQVHATRLRTIITRPVPDILKPAYNFGGISLSQLAEPYVDNWLRTRQSIADLVNNFSITILKTAMDAVLQGSDMGDSVIKRAQLFAAMRSNLGLMLLDKTNEELDQINTPLSGLADLQSQSLEQLCVVSRIPSVILTGLSPMGLNASSDGEIRVFYDWIAAQQEAFWRDPIKVVLDLVQLSEFGEIDPAIGFKFVPLFQMTAKELAEIRKSDADAAAVYINAGVIAPEEERERLAKDPQSGYEGLDLDAVIVPPNDGTNDPADDMGEDGWNEADHPRGPDGKFGTGSGSALFDDDGFPLNYEAAKQTRDKLEQVTKELKQKMDTYPKGAFNMTPDDVKATQEWQEDFNKINKATKRLQNFNEYFVKTYKKERDAERAARHAAH